MPSSCEGGKNSPKTEVGTTQCVTLISINRKDSNGGQYGGILCKEGNRPEYLHLIPFN